jgi:hypothetical protein
MIREASLMVVRRLYRVEDAAQYYAKNHFASRCLCCWQMRVVAAPSLFQHTELPHPAGFFTRPATSSACLPYCAVNFVWINLSTVSTCCEHYLASSPDCSGTFP